MFLLSRLREKLLGGSPRDSPGRAALCCYVPVQQPLGNKKPICSDQLLRRRHALPTPATDAVMGALSEAQAGIGSAMNTVSRLVAGSIGVAALGSVLSTIYSSSFREAASTIAGLPAEIIEGASDSVGAAVIIADKLPAGIGEPLAFAARQSFMDGWQVMTFFTCGMSVVGAILAFKFMPPRHEPLPGEGDQ